ncbi:MAG: hypothetical protein OXH77_04855 [Anaerolineaceae bacterium]|nr:hypothetical protein [Anaerolineaceae bacterium]
MKTSCFSLYKGPGRVGISVGRPRNINPGDYEVYPALAPEWSWLGLTRAEYLPLYHERLAGLDAQQVWDELHALVPGEEPVLLCFEEPPFTADHWCHRQLVAQWFREELGQEVTEVEIGLSRQAPPPVTDGEGDAATPEERLIDHEDYVDPRSRSLTDPVSLEELQEHCERHYAALEALWQAQRKGDQEAADLADIEVALARVQVLAGWKRMSAIERALAVQRRMIPESIIRDV